MSFTSSSLQKAKDWLIYSSKDPQKISLTIKGILLGIVPVFVIVAHLAGWNITGVQANSLVEVFAEMVSQLLALVAGFQVVYGLGRKFYYLLKDSFNNPSIPPEEQPPTPPII